jgi:exopolysaccharide production protein ExoQ
MAGPARRPRVDAMPPLLALLLWFILVLGLLILDPARDSRVSSALWVPLIWIFIVASRLPAQWLGQGGASARQTLEEGNPIDRTVFLLVIVLSVGILILRAFNWGQWVKRNIALVTFIGFCLFSVLWSDSPLISFKRWYRDLGNYLVVLVVLSDRYPLEAIGTVLRRLCYLLIPLSIVLIKYFGDWGRQYSAWTGVATYVGATTSKNMLGALCLVSAIFFFWDTLTRWSELKEWRTKRIFLVNFALLGMTLWLMNLASSATSSVCLVMGCLVIAAARSRWGRHNPRLLKVMIPAFFCIYLVLAFGFNANGELAGAVGRDPTLTDRTKIWGLVLSMHTNPLLGTGYESFWLGSRLQAIWRAFGPLNESHNGYLEIYLNLGLIGIFLLGAVLVTSYRSICRQLTSATSLASLNLAFWTIMLFYNMTEAAFKFHMMWVTFLLAAMAVPNRAPNYVRDVTMPQTAAAKQLRGPRLGVATTRR